VVEHFQLRATLAPLCELVCKENNISSLPSPLSRVVSVAVINTRAKTCKISKEAFSP
jgi:hypothetical protein